MKVVKLALLMVMLVGVFMVNMQPVQASFCTADFGYCVVGGGSDTCCSNVCCHAEGQTTGACSYGGTPGSCLGIGTCEGNACADSNHCCLNTICNGADPRNHVLGNCL